MNMKSITLITLVLLIAVGVYLAISPTSRPSSNVAIGGDFSLTTPMGEMVSNESLKGQMRLVYFGFTYCPDVCPMGLQIMQTAMEELKDENIRAFFITVDPERDTPEHLATFMENFPDIIGLSGTPEQIKQAAKSYRVYYRKVEDEKSPDSYTMDHTSLIYVMDENGHYLAHFPHTADPRQIINSVRKAAKSS